MTWRQEFEKVFIWSRNADNKKERGGKKKKGLGHDRRPSWQSTWQTSTNINPWAVRKDSQWMVDSNPLSCRSLSLSTRGPLLSFPFFAYALSHRLVTRAPLCRLIWREGHRFPARNGRFGSSVRQSTPASAAESYQAKGQAAVAWVCFNCHTCRSSCHLFLVNSSCH